MTHARIVFFGFRHVHIHALYRRALEDARVEIVACIEPDAQARAAAAQALGITFSPCTYEQILNDPTVDTVAIGCAYGDRGEAVRMALEHGKHVIADKPICTSRAELDVIERLASERQLTVACMLDLRYLPQVRRVQQLLDEGSLGEIRNITVGGQHCIDYANRPAWYFENGMHGGTINDLAIHGIDLIRMLTKKEFVTVDAARVWNSFANKHSHFKDCAMVMARLDGGVGVLADVSYSAPTQVFTMPTYWEFRLWCEEGLISFCYADYLTKKAIPI